MAKFMSRCQNQVLCMKPKRMQIIDGIAIPVEGEHIRFENGEFETDDKKKIDYLKKHRLYGSQIVEVKQTDKDAAGE